MAPSFKDPKKVVLEEYHQLMNLFSKLLAQQLPPHQSFYHKIMIICQKENWEL
jgi:hypothetical protein